MDQKLYDILYSGYNKYKPQDMTDVVNIQLQNEQNSINARRLQQSINALYAIDAAEESRIKRQQSMLLEQTAEGLDLREAVSIDPRKQLEYASNQVNGDKNTERLLYSNVGNWRNRYIQTMAATDWGGMFGVPSQRAVSGRWGGVSDVAMAFKSVDMAGFRSLMEAGEAHGTLANESVLDEFNTGWPVLEMLYKVNRGFTMGADEVSSWWTGIEQNSIDDFSGAADLPGTPLYDILHKVDPNWDKRKKDILVSKWFEDPNLAITAQMIGLTEKELYETRSFGHAMAMINAKMTSYEAMQYASTATGVQMFGDFMSNLGATIITDPEMLAEFTITAGAGLGMQAGKLTAMGGRRLALMGYQNQRLLTAAEIVGKTSGVSKILKTSQILAQKGIGKTLQVGGSLLTTTAAATSAANPFTIGERIVYPALKNLRLVSKSGTLFEKTKEGRRLREAVRNTRLGATGVVLRNTILNPSDTTLKGTLLSAMIDGGLQNFAAYAFTRDEEWAFTEAVMGDSADASHIAFQMYRGDGFLNFMNSGLGAFTLGMGFGSIMGLGMRALSLQAVDPATLPKVEGMDLPILKNPVASLNKFQKNLKIRLEANAKQITSNAVSFAASITKPSIEGAHIAATFLAGKMAQAGTLTAHGVQNLEAIVLSAMVQGVNIQKAARRLIKGGSIDLAELKRIIVEEIKTPEARARRRAMKGKVPVELRLAAQAFNTARIQYAIDNGLDFGDGGHMNALQSLISSTEAGPIRDGLVILADNTAKFTDDVLDLLKEAIRGFDNWDELDATTKQRVLDDAIAAADLEGVTLRLEDFENKVRTVSGEDVASRRAKERQIAEQNFREQQRIQAEAEARRTESAGVEEPTNLDTMNQKELNRFIDENNVPGGKGGSNEAKRQRIRDWLASRRVEEPEVSPTPAFILPGRGDANTGADYTQSVDVTSITETAANGMEVQVENNWHYRLPKNWSRTNNPIVARASANVVGNADMIKRLDAFFDWTFDPNSKTGLGYYRTPDQTNGWESRHDPITLYLTRQLTDDEKAELSSIFEPHNRGDATLFGTKVSDGFFILDDPSDVNIRSMVEAPASRVEPEAEVRAPEAAVSRTEPTEPVQEQLTFDYVERSAAEVSRELALEETLRSSIEEAALRDVIDGEGVAALALREGQAKLDTIDQNITAAQIRHLVELTKAEEADARNRNIDPTWNIKEVVRRSKERADKVRAVTNTTETDRASNEILADLPKNDKGKIVGADIKRLIYKEFGMDVQIDAEVEGRVIEGATVSELADLYRDLRVLKSISDIDPKAKADLETDPVLAVAVGKPEAQRALARELVRVIRGLAEDPRYAERIPTHVLAGAMPAGFEGLMHTVFKDLEVRAGNYFETHGVRLEAERRLAYADENFRKSYLIEAQKRKESLSLSERALFDEILQYNNTAAATRAFFRRRTNAQRTGVDHAFRIESRLRDGQTIGDYIIQEFSSYINGVLEGWSKIPTGLFKDALARRLGIADLASKKDIFKNIGLEANPEKRRELAKLRKEFADRLWDKAHELAGLTARPAYELWNGVADSQRGYVVGRALIEAVSGQVAADRVATTALADVKVDSGYLGRMSNTNFVRMFQKHTREAVVRHVLGMGSGEIPGSTLRYLTADDVEAIIKDLEAFRDAVRSGTMTDDMKARINSVGYEAYERLTLAPKSVIKDLDRRITNIRKFIEEEIRNVLDAPPGVINMLHDEMSVNQTVTDILFIKGDTAENVVTLNPDLSGDIGLKSAITTPGSWKDIWNLRSEAIFGTTQGFSRIASFLGMTNLEKAINDFDGDIVKFVQQFELMNNAEDASSQAVTMAQAIMRDLDIDNKNAEGQKKFAEALQKITRLFHKAGGLDKIRRNLDIAANEYMTAYTADPKAIDKYSQVALRFLRDKPPSDAWGRLFAMSKTPEDATALNTKSLGAGDISGDIGTILRKKIFKPPVMTIVYGAGAPAFRKQILEGLEEIAEVIAKKDADAAVRFRSEISDMANDLVEEIVQNDLIRKELGLPKAEDLVKAFRNRKLSDNLIVRDETGTITKVYTVGDIVSGEWLTGPHHNQVMNHLLKLSMEQFEVQSHELGLWYAKLLINNDGKKLKRAVENMRKKIRDSYDDDGKFNLDKLNEQFTPINTYLSSIESSNRLGYLADNKIVTRQMERLGVELEDLDPLVARALMHKMALYQNTGPAAGRKFGFFDGPTIIRNQNPETTVHETLNVDNFEQIGQVTLDDGFVHMMGLKDVDVEDRVRDAVVKQLLIELGAIIAPTRLAGSEEFKFPTIESFYRDIHAMEDMGNPAARRMDQRDHNQARIRELNDKPKNELTKEEQDELTELKGFEQTVYGKDDDGNIRLTNGSGLLAAQISAVAHFDVHSSVDRPTTLGVPYLQQLAFAANDASIRMSTFDAETERGIISNAVAFKPEEVTPVSLLHPEYIAKAKEVFDGRPSNATDQQIAQTMGNRTKESIDAEKASEQVYANERNLSTNGVRLTRLLRRLESSMQADMRLLEIRYSAKPEELEARKKGLRRKYLAKITRGWMNTTGEAMSTKEAKRNAFKLPKRPIKFNTKQDVTLLEALQHVIRENDISEFAGLMLGPSERIGIDLRKLGQTENIMPFSSARAPMTVFALDWYMMGGASRDYVMYTVYRIADEEGTDVRTVIKEMQEGGFRKRLEQFINERYDFSNPEDAARYFENSEMYKSQLDDRYADEFDIEIKSLGDQIDAEFGIEMPPLPIQLGRDEKIRFVGILQYLKQDPERVKYLNDATGLDLNAEQIALSYSLPRERLMELAEANDPTSIFIPRQTVNREGAPKLSEGEIDRINSRDIVDENVRPDQMPLFSYDQITHLLNMPSNRNLVAMLALHQITGLDIDLQMRLDHQVKDVVDGFNNGEEPHGFASNPRSSEEASLLIDDQGGDMLGGIGAIAKDDYGIKPPKVEGDKGPQFDFLETLGAGQLVHSLRMAVNGALTPEGVTLLKRLGVVEPEQIKQVLRYADEIKNKLADMEHERMIRETELATASNREAVIAEDERIRFENGYEEPEGPSPFRGEETSAEKPSLAGPTETPKVEEPLPASPDGDVSKGSYIDISVSTTPARTDAGEAFRALLTRQTDRGSAISRNILSFFDAMTGRDGQAKVNERISDSEAMTLLEIAYLDKDLANALFGGEMNVEFDGSAHIEMIAGMDNSGGRMRTIFRGLAEVNQKMKEGRADAATYLLLHELVERMDLGHAISGRGIDDTPARNKVKSAINTHFITNFGTAKARDKWRAIMKGLGLYDARMEKFLKDVEQFFEASSKRRAEYMDEDLYEARKNMFLSEKNPYGGHYTHIPEFIAEGYTQALTLALFSRNIDRLGVDSPVRGLESVAGYLRSKLVKMVDFLTHFGITTEPAKGVSLAELAGSQAKRGRYQDQLLLQLQLISRNLDWDEIITESHAGMSGWGQVRGPDGRMVRYFGGRGEAPAFRPIAEIKAELNDVISKLGTANRFTRHALQIRADQLRNELGLAMVDPDAYAKDLEAAKAKGDMAKDDEGLIDLTKFQDANERVGVINSTVDLFLSNIQAERSTGIGRFFNWFAGRLVAGQGSYAAANSEFAPVRAIGQLMNPEMINGKTNNQTWIPDQMAMSSLGSDLSKAVQNLEWYRKRIQKLKSADLRNFQLTFDGAMRTHKKDVRLKAYQSLGLNDREINTAEYWHHFMFDPDYGFIDRMARHMVSAGIISEHQHATFRDIPGLSLQLIRDSADIPEAQNTIRTVLKTIGRKHLVNRLRDNVVEVDILESAGILMQRGMVTEQAIKANFDDLTPEQRDLFLKLADEMEANGMEVSTVDFLRAYKASEFLREEMKRPRETRSTWSEPFSNSRVINQGYIDAIRNDVSIHSYNADGTRNTSTTRASLLWDNKDTLDVYQPQSGLDLMAHKEFVDLKTGGKLGDSRLIGNRHRALIGSDIEGYLDFDIQNQLNSFIGSNSMMAAGTAVQQRAIGIRGANTMFLIDNLLQRIETSPSSLRGDDGQPLSGIQLERMKEELMALKNQLRVGYNLRPIGVKDEGSGGRALRTASRIGVSLVSAGNFALSAIVEILAGLPRTLGKIMYGDLRAIGDYFTMISPAARKRVMESADGFDIVKMHLGVHTRFGDMGYDDIRDMTGYDRTSSWISADGLERLSRKMSNFAMLGFSSFTEYARAISVAQAIRHAKRISGNRHGGYKALGEALEKLGPNATAAEIRGAARAVGIDGQEAVHLAQSGMASKENLARVNQLLQSEYFTNQGLDMQSIYRHNAFNNYEVATVKAILQFQNNKLNLDPRMGNKIVPTNVFEHMFSILGQFPLLFYSRMRQSAYQGGGMAVGSFLLFMLLGEMYYTNLALMARGEDLSEILERVKSGDPGWILNTLENMNVLGAGSPVLAYLVGSSINMLRDVTDNPELLGTYQTGIRRSLVNLAGLEMLKTGIVKLSSGTANLFAGNVEQGVSQIAGAAPIPAKQLIKIALHQGLADTDVGRMISMGRAVSRDIDPPVTMYDAARAAKLLEQDEQAPEASRTLSEPSQVSKATQTPPERQTPQTGSSEPPELIRRLGDQAGASTNLVSKLE